MLRDFVFGGSDCWWFRVPYWNVLDRLANKHGLHVQLVFNVMKKKTFFHVIFASGIQNIICFFLLFVNGTVHF